MLEFGSRNVNGSVRPFFKAESYTGVDFTDGPDVDVVSMADQYDGPAADVVICCEMLEHDPNAEASVKNMARLCKQAMVITCAGLGRAEHGTPSTSEPDDIWGPVPHFYRNVTPRQLLTWVGIEWRAMGMEYSRDRGDLYWWGIRCS